ncbi:MAG TPA: CorA family divalent cation transporter [Accumulibacter sp.]|uniref:CorA family divalent cation transporter n=1 Tax=Accumulibacter sp. TaxID=2053492 RepID=UPI002BDBE6EB|nr:CorA family divalent cation transporter [Accumulibacter sp.]HRD87952.1 CorA family divalent cation transporter [Accumulibacter sp.]
MPERIISEQALRELLSKQKLYEGLLHSQHGVRQPIVESLVHRQHVAEIANRLDGMPSQAIAGLLEALPIDEAHSLWTCLPAARENEVLWELSDALRETLVGSREPRFAESRINAFDVVDGRVRQVCIGGRHDLEGIQPAWLDLLGATDPERRYVGEHFGVTLPDPGQTTGLEISSRFQIDGMGSLRLWSNFLLYRDGVSKSIPVVFIVHQGILFTVRNEDLPVFRLQGQRARSQTGSAADSIDLILDLYGADVEYSADVLESIYQRLGEIGRQVLSEAMSDEDAATVLAGIAEEEGLNGRIRGNILDTQRALFFLIRSRRLLPGQLDDAKQILRDIDSLNSHTAFLFDKINFLMDATVGFININQNKQVSRLTIFSVVIMPLNMVAGIGGMSEFSMMTAGIPWPSAYAGLAAAMGLMGWGTYLMLRRLGTGRKPKGR